MRELSDLHNNLMHYNYYIFTPLEFLSKRAKSLKGPTMVYYSLFQIFQLIHYVDAMDYL
jgi:hypothetical protein